MKPEMKLSGAALGAIAATFLMAGMAVAEDNVQKGTLKCDVEGGIGLLLGSKKDMTCVFTKTDGTVENYTGRVLTIGVDIGVTKESHIAWAVLAPSGENDAGAMAGSYTGVTAEATVAGGVGANVLVSAGNQFTLQPISVQTQTGLNIAGGIGSIKLEYVK
jgi:hypothetical protein